LSKLPAVLSANVYQLHAQQARLGSQIPTLLSEMLQGIRRRNLDMSNFHFRLWT
jgi:hypothetical protein